MRDIDKMKAIGVVVAALVLAFGPSGVALAEPSGGEAIFTQKCALCHASTVIEGFGKLGPNLLGVVGRPAASVPGFAYTDALKASRFVWTRETLGAFLANPPKMFKGVNMPLALRDPGERAAVIAYLETLR